MAESNNVKLKDYFKQAEIIIENNLKIIMPYMLIYILVNVGIDKLMYNVDTSVGNLNQLDVQAQISYFYIIWVGIVVVGLTNTILETLVLLKTNTGLDFVEDKRVNGSVSRKIGRLILAHFIISTVLSIIIGVIGIIGMVLFAVNQGLGAFFFLVMSIPFSVLIILMSIITKCVDFEIIIKDTKAIESLKATYKNIMKSKNKTLSKLLAGFGVLVLVSFAIAMIAGVSTNGSQSVISLILVNALQAATLVYFLAYNLIVYMSSEAQGGRTVVDIGKEELEKQELETQGGENNGY